MSNVLHTTKAVILRTVKYGETSLIISAYTELYGLQSYIVQGVRTSSKKGAGKANYFQPGSMLELIVYHHDLKNLQRIKDFKWSYLYEQLFADVIKNSVLLYMVELLQKCVKQPENNPDLFYFIEDALMQLDKSGDAVTANFPLYFALHLTNFFGFQINTEEADKYDIPDLQEGNFVSTYPQHVYYVDGKTVELIRELLKAMQPHELIEIPMNYLQRRQLLETLETYYALHIPEFGKLKTLPVLQQIMEP
ncbi:MAG: DNA repair protein RecO [Chitinophagaceae bacterium]|nr:DNA repair protein RecO [Chitinophagaceae bacterium]